MYDNFNTVFELMYRHHKKPMLPKTKFNGAKTY